ncbi:hypothetical protein KKH23_06390 [Patescibacteria group bacterium]|uniref:Uncharacterized protein n=1 Tax=viral metagenome TaxID=1070528 RepID=A0A6M3MES5_9ZZZZ|nr:hypothetical protein [Patescibacteria group bacterium]MBU0846803.1 hypothetical protein [Patescibacteria group bacterium]MBU1067835.1 hypothetical protein [Patescibacteria group bacterium]
MTKYLLLAVLFLVGLSFFAIKGCVSNSDKLKNETLLRKNSDFDVANLKKLVNELQQAKTSTEVTWTEKYGHLSKLYDVMIIRYQKEIELLKNDPTRIIMVPCDSIPIGYQVDTMRNDDVDIFWKALVLGRIRSMDINYKLKIPTIIQNNIIYDTLYLTKEVKVPTRKWGLYLAGGLSTDLNLIDLGVDFYTNKRLGFGYRYSVVRLEGSSKNFNSFEVKYLLFSK